LPEIAKVVGVSTSQSLHHFIANSPWSVAELKARRLTLTLEALKKKKVTVVIDETGDRKKEQTQIMWLDNTWEVSEK
jgi:SRSO17 transposase